MFGGNMRGEFGLSLHFCPLLVSLIQRLTLAFSTDPASFIMTGFTTTTSDPDRFNSSIHGELRIAPLASSAWHWS